MKTEIIQKIEALLEQSELRQSGEAFKTLSDQFYKIINEEERAFEIEKLERIEAGEKPENIVYPVDPLKDQFKTLSQTFKTRRKAELDAVKAEEEEPI